MHRAHSNKRELAKLLFFQLLSHAAPTTELL